MSRPDPELRRDDELFEALNELFPSTPEAPPAAVWQRLAPDVQALAARRRLRSAFAQIFFRPRVALGLASAGLAVVLAAVVWFGGSGLRAAEAVIVLDASTASTRTVLANGASVALARGSAEILQSDPSHARVLLLSGEISAAVPPLGKQRSLMVRTAEVDVVVHGTRFVVMRDDSTTFVRVEEGLVEVRPRGGQRPVRWLRAGDVAEIPDLRTWTVQRWKALAPRLERMECGAVEAQYAELLNLPTAGQDVAVAQYVLAYCAAERGETAHAVALFEQAAARASDVIRAENALARAAQLSRALGSQRHADAWRRYLTRFPAGRHRALAEAELGSPGADR